MGLTLQVFRSRVARRVFVLVLAALVPVTATMLLTLNQAARTLSEAAQQQLRDASRSYGQTFYERLTLANDALSQLSRDVELLEEEEHRPSELDAAVVVNGGEVTRLFGDLVLGGLEWSLSADSIKSLLRIRSGLEGPEILIVHPPSPNGDVKVGRVSSDFLWNTQALPYGLEFCALSSSTTRELFCTSSPPRTDIGALINTPTSSSGDLLWERAGERYLSAYWKLFTQSRFDGESWLIIVSQSESIALAPLIALNRMIPPIIALSLIVVTLLSIWQIRRSMRPLDRLVQETKRIAQRDFGTRITLDGDDEFRELADALNGMAGRLDLQFRALETLAQIDNLILSSGGVEQVIETVLNQSKSIIRCSAAGMILLDLDAPDMGQLYLSSTGCDRARLKRIPMGEDDCNWLRKHPRGQFLTSRDANFMASLGDELLVRAAVFPILKRKTLAGALLFGFREKAVVPEESQQAARDLADRMAVAFSASEREAELFHQAHFDALTGLPNRQLFQDRLRQALAQARRDEQQLAVLFMDLDGFKTINDSLGHSSGDHLLVQAASRLTSCLRETDTVARLGGDEFVVIIPRAIGTTEIEATAAHIMSALRRPFNIQGQQRFITASIGVTIYPDDGNTVETLLQKADTAMYVAKEAGRAQCVFFASEMEDRAAERLSLETDLRHALDREELQLRFQPQLDLVSDEITTAEALIRWMHPKRGQIPPSLFVPILERLRLIEQVGFWVIRAAASQLRQWQGSGLPIEKIAVNISASEFRQKNFVHQIEEAMRNSGISTRCLELELTESAVVQNVARSNRIFRALRSLGVTIAIDDFGTGYSSLSYLNDLEFDALKIDQSFIRKVPDPQAVAILKAIIDVARSLNKTVIAEGVENDVQLAHLKDLGSNLAQGFFICRPLDIDDFAHWLSKTAAGEDLSPSFVARALG